jgi:hypothetical protein
VNVLSGEAAGRGNETSPPGGRGPNLAPQIVWEVVGHPMRRFCLLTLALLFGFIVLAGCGGTPSETKGRPAKAREAIDNAKK